jgi:hypothetical protein
MVHLMVACELVSRSIYACLEFGIQTDLRTPERKVKYFGAHVHSGLRGAMLLIVVAASLCLWQMSSAVTDTLQWR